MEIITADQLLSFCQASLIQLPNYTNQSLTALQVMYGAGCRPAEAVDLSRWSLIDANTFQLNPLKNNFPRFVPVADLPQLFVDYFTGGSQEYQFATLSRASYYFAKVWPTSQIYKGSKQSDMYLYRYNYVKQLAEDGLTIDQIKLAMGWNSSAMAERYVNSVLFIP